MNFVAKYIHIFGLLLFSAFVAAAACLYFDVPARFQSSSPTGPAKPAYSCSMHPDVVQDRAGNCPKCRMTLVAVTTASVSHADCEHAGASDGCCPKSAAAGMRLPPGHPSVRMQLPPGHPPINQPQTNVISSTAWKPGS